MKRLQESDEESLEDDFIVDDGYGKYYDPLDYGSEEERR